MKQTILYGGLDVDDTRYPSSAFDQCTCAGLDSQCRPTLRGLVRPHEKLSRHIPGCVIRVCEDAAQLPQFCAHGLLELTSILEPVQEQGRDLLRTRQHLVDQQTTLRKHLQALLRRNGLHDQAQTHSRPY